MLILNSNRNKFLEHSRKLQMMILNKDIWAEEHRQQDRWLQRNTFEKNVVDVYRKKT